MASFYDLEEQDWFDATGEKRPSGYVDPPAWMVYMRRSDGMRGVFPGVGRRFRPDSADVPTPSTLTPE